MGTVYPLARCKCLLPNLLTTACVLGLACSTTTKFSITDTYPRRYHLTKLRQAPLSMVCGASVKPAGSTVEAVSQTQCRRGKADEKRPPNVGRCAGHCICCRYVYWLSPHEANPSGEDPPRDAGAVPINSSAPRSGEPRVRKKNEGRARKMVNVGHSFPIASGLICKLMPLLLQGIGRVFAKTLRVGLR